MDLVNYPEEIETKGEIIKDRTVAPVKGIDLEHAVNFTRETGIGVEWFYTSYTYPRCFYQKGSRPDLEKIVNENIDQNASETEKLNLILVFMDKNLPHAVHLVENCMCELHIPYPPDRGTTEEEILNSGWGWCNEQARVFIALSQISGLPSRLVFTSRPNKTGHVMSEVYVTGKWGLVDQSASYAFRDKSGTPVNVLDMRKSDSLTEEINGLYREAIIKDGKRAKDDRFTREGDGYLAIPNPVELFTKVGYHNYFIH